MVKFQTIIRIGLSVIWLFILALVVFFVYHVIDKDYDAVGNLSTIKYIVIVCFPIFALSPILIYSCFKPNKYGKYAGMLAIVNFFIQASFAFKDIVLDYMYGIVVLFEQYDTAFTNLGLLILSILTYKFVNWSQNARSGKSLTK